MDPITQGSATTNTVIELLWTEPDDAGSPVIGYVVKYKLVEESDYQELVSNYNLQSYQITHDVIEGAQYQFIARAVNKWGYAAEWSEPTTILAATTPEQTDGLVSSIDPATGGFKIEWTAPHHRGSPITEYVVQV